MKPCSTCVYWRPSDISRTRNLGLCDRPLNFKDDTADRKREPPGPSPVSLFCEHHLVRRNCSTRYY